MCGTTCVETCTYKPTLCNKMCRLGCFCNDGYVRLSNATSSPCAKREDCPAGKDVTTCGQNEQYLPCAFECPRTCGDLRYPLGKLSRACFDCVPGCYCKLGFYRNEKRQCVAPDQCCGENEKYQSCGTTCVETCSEKPTVCTTICAAGCFCNCSNYVRQSNVTASPCIPRETCPKRCANDN